ncbi:methyltransferase [Aureimonas fodinaquatilis]|uniref:Methyltransferase n=1 Tax=Aureimonas fodinaquatilis TaxID=2565783 RepID=A0A5B0E398_9HYPH|nr:methyltransferase [Aureimonas fodinaquatilis]KAA0972451.1 methyltransferase [Aureimonas fodinaquatilis]
MSCADTAIATRVDAFWHGAFYLAQPVAVGHRSGLDAMLVAACVRADWQGKALDMGAGAGAIGIAAATRASGLTVTLAELDDAMAVAAQESIALPQNAGVSSRVTFTQIDLTATRIAREAAGLRDGAFDYVLTNPPFYAHDHRASPDDVRRAALSMPDDEFLLRWISVAAGLCRIGGQMVMVLQPDNLTQVLAALPGRFGKVSIRPVHTRPGTAASRILLAGVRGSRAPLRILPELALRNGEGSLNPQAQALGAGTLQLDV